MKTKSAIRYTNQLLKKYGTFDIVGNKLSISGRYVRILAKGEKRASLPLIKLMKVLLEK